MKEEYSCKVFTQAHSEINGHGIWHYLIDTPLAQIHIIEYEMSGLEIKRHLIDSDNEKAEKKYASILSKMVKEYC